MHLTYRKTCRVCGSTALKPVIDLGEQHLQGSFVQGRQGDPAAAQDRTARWCAAIRRATRTRAACCRCAQSVPPEVLYSAYWYRSGTNDTMREHLRASPTRRPRWSGEPNASVLDIGCNDGTLLTCVSEGLRASSGSIRPTSPARSTSRTSRWCRTSSRRAELDRLAAGTQVRHHHVDRDVLRPRGPGRVRARDQEVPGARGHLDLRDVVHADDAAR